jgi:hypothetical protein
MSHPPTTPIPSETHFEMTDLDRRAWPRFARRVRVLLLPEDSAIEEPFGAWIINGSRGGVRLVMTTPIEEGTVLHLCTLQSLRGETWVPVRVMNRCERDGAWEMGCEFLRPVLQETAVLFN